MTDYAAMAAYKKGSQEAFSLLFSRYKDAVKGWCFRYLENNDDAEDVSQNVWLDLVQYLKHAKDGDHFSDEMKEGRFKNLAYRVARNRSLDYIRNKAEEAESTTFMSHEKLAELDVEYGLRPDSDLLVNDMLKDLDLEERALVIAIVFEGHTAEEDDLAGKLGVARSTVNRRYDRAIEKLREALEKAVHRLERIDGFGCPQDILDGMRAAYKETENGNSNS